MRFHNCVEAHGVVQTRLDVARAVRGCAVVIAHLDGNRLRAALEVRADRRAENAEFKLRRGLHADDAVRANHERADVQARARAIRRHKIRIRRDDLLHRVHELVHREGRHFQPRGAVRHALGVHVRAEANDMPVLGVVCLHALKARLAILEDAGAFIQGDVCVGFQPAFVPMTVLVAANVAIIRLDIAEAEIAPVDVLLAHCSYTPFGGFRLYYRTKCG